MLSCSSWASKAPSFLPSSCGSLGSPAEVCASLCSHKKGGQAAREAHGHSGALSHGKTPLASNAGPMGKKPAKPGSRNPVGSCSPSVGVSAVCSPGAVDEMGYKPFYAEECASMLAVTFSGGDKLMRSIVSRSPLERLACLSFLSTGGALSLLMPRRIPQVFPDGLLWGADKLHLLSSRALLAYIFHLASHGQRKSQLRPLEDLATFVGKGPGTGSLGLSFRPPRGRGGKRAPLFQAPLWLLFFVAATAAFPIGNSVSSLLLLLHDRDPFLSASVGDAGPNAGSQPDRSILP